MGKAAFVPDMVVVDKQAAALKPGHIGRRPIVCTFVPPHSAPGYIILPSAARHWPARRYLKVQRPATADDGFLCYVARSHAAAYGFQFVRAFTTKGEALAHDARRQRNTAVVVVANVRPPLDTPKRYRADRQYLEYATVEQGTYCTTEQPVVVQVRAYALRNVS